MALEADYRQKRTVLFLIWFLILCLCGAILLDVTHDGPCRFPTWFEARFAIFFALYTVAVGYELQCKRIGVMEGPYGSGGADPRSPSRVDRPERRVRRSPEVRQEASPNESAKAQPRNRGPQP